jgi:C4-dicarboxylate transporter, DctM subunit
MNLFLINGITSAPLGEVIRGAIPYVFLLILGLSITWAFPQLSLWLPQTAGFGR